MKKYIPLIFFISLLPLFSTVTAMGASSDQSWKPLFQAALKLYNFTAYDEALGLIDQTISILKSDENKSTQASEKLAESYIMKGGIIFFKQKDRKKAGNEFTKALLAYPDISPQPGLLPNNELKSIFSEAKKNHAKFIDDTFLNAVKLYAQKQYCPAKALLKSIEGSYNDKETLQSILTDSTEKCGGGKRQADGQQANKSERAKSIAPGIAVMPFIYTSKMRDDFHKIVRSRVRMADVMATLKKYGNQSSEGLSEDELKSICDLHGVKPQDLILRQGQVHINAENPFKNDQGKMNIEVKLMELLSNGTEVMEKLFEKCKRGKLLFLYYKDTTTDSSSLTNPNHEDIDIIGNLYSMESPNKPVLIESRLAITNSRYLLSKTEDVIEDMFQH